MPLGEPDTFNRERIWLVNLFFGSGVAPTGLLLESVAVGLTEAGLDVQVLTGRATYNRGSESVSHRFPGPVRQIYTGLAHSLGFLGRLLTWLTFYFGVIWYTFTHRVPDKVLVLSTPPFLHSIFVLRNMFVRRKAQLILWNQDTFPETLGAVGILRTNSLFYRLLLTVQRWSTSRVDKVIVLDQAMKQILEQHGARRITIIPNWQNDLTPASDLEQNDVNKRIQDARRSFRYIVVYTGNYGWGHDLGILFEWLRSHPDQRDFFFLFVGGGEKWNQLEDLQAMIKAANDSAPESVGVFPYVATSQYPGLLDQADFGMAALEEACLGLQSPSKIHGYLAHGKPLLYIGPKRSNVADAIEQYQCGFQIDEHDIVGLERCLAGLLSAQFDYASLSRRAEWASVARYVERVGVSGVVAFVVDR